MLAFPESKICDRVQNLITSHFSNSTFFRSLDGQDAWSRIDNVTPHVVLLSSHLLKIDGLRLAKKILADRRSDGTAIIFLENPPEEQIFVDEIINQRIQFLGNDVEPARLHQAVVKALNVVSSRQKSEFHLRYLAAGDPLLKEGARADFVYIVRSGTLQAFRRGDPPVLLGTIEAGEFVGEMAYINNHPRSADVVAVSDCELIEIPVDHLDHLLYRNPAWSKALLRTLSKRVKTSNEIKAKVDSDS